MKRIHLLGVGFILSIGLVARLIASLSPAVDHLLLSILIGILIGNIFGIPEWARPGVGTHKLWLETAIVVMGASVSLDRIWSAGPEIILLVVATVGLTILVVELLSRFVFSIHEKTGSLLAAGSAICGVSAVVAVAESLSVDETRIAYAVATVLLLDAVTLFAYPLIGHALGLSDTVFGVWTGLTMLSTGPVAAAGFAFSESAGQWAVLVKLTRNSMIGVAAIAYAVYYVHRSSRDASVEATSNSRLLWNNFPKFILGFLAVMILANLGLLNAQQVTSLSHAADWAFLLAFAGLGLEIQIDELRSTGYVPILTVLVGLVIVATTVLLVVDGLF